MLIHRVSKSDTLFIFLKNSCQIQVRVQLPTSADNVTLPTFAAVQHGAAAADRQPAGRAAIDRFWPPGPQQQTRRTLMLTGQADKQTDTVRQTDGRTDARQFHRPFSTQNLCIVLHTAPRYIVHKKLSYRRVTARCVLSVVILPITTQRYRNYLYDKS